jgi:hypothetical protein
MEQLWQCVTDGEELSLPEMNDDSDSSEDLMAISFQAHSGTEGARTLRLRGYLQDKEIFMLVDSGNSHSFISEHMASFVSPWQPLSHSIQVQVAMGLAYHAHMSCPTKFGGAKAILSPPP